MKSSCAFCESKTLFDASMSANYVQDTYVARRHNITVCVCCKQVRPNLITLWCCPMARACLQICLTRASTCVRVVRRTKQSWLAFCARWFVPKTLKTVCKLFATTTMTSRLGNQNTVFTCLLQIPHVCSLFFEQNNVVKEVVGRVLPVARLTVQSDICCLPSSISVRV